MCVLWGRWPTHVAAGSRLRSEAHQSASSVRLQGPSVSLVSQPLVSQALRPISQALRLVSQAPRPVSQPHRLGSKARQSAPRQSGSEARQSAPLQSGSEARQSASSVRLRGPSVSLISQAPRPVSQPRRLGSKSRQSAPCQSGSEARQSASSVRLRGPSVSLASGQGLGGSRLPGSQARKAVLPGLVRGPACHWALFGPSASIPNLPLAEHLGPAGQQRRASPPGPAGVLSFFS